MVKAVQVVDGVADADDGKIRMCYKTRISLSVKNKVSN